MKLCDDDKHLIATVDDQVKLLLDKGASESDIVNTLMEFIPQIQCLIHNCDETELKLYLNKYSSFAYLATIIKMARVRSSKFCRLIKSMGYDFMARLAPPDLRFTYAVTH